MDIALNDAGRPHIDYINAHATSTVLGDATELEAIRRVFTPALPVVSSTKGLTGHAIAAAGAHEAIYSLLMMHGGFLAANANLSNTDDNESASSLIRTVRHQNIGTVLSNSLGFGGTNVSLVFRRQ